MPNGGESVATRQIPSLPRLADPKQLLQWAKRLVEAMQQYLLTLGTIFPQWIWVAQPASAANLQPGQVSRNNASMSATTQVWIHSIDTGSLDHTNHFNAIMYGGGQGQQDLLIMVTTTSSVRYKITGLSSTQAVDGNAYILTVGFIALAGPDEPVGVSAGVHVSYVATS